MNIYRRIVWWYLATPVLLFCLFWYNCIIGFPLFYGLLFAVDYASQYSDIPNNPNAIYRFPVFLKFLTVILTGLVAWGALTAGYWDWQIHRTQFYDLTRCYWPIGYNFKGSTYLFSYYLMFFIPPAAISRIIGLQWLQETVALWTFIGYGLVFWGYFSRSKNILEWLFLFFLLMTFCGWDAIGCLWRDGKWPTYAVHFINWNRTETNTNIIPFYWAPQHVIPAWLSGILLFRPELKTEDKARFSILLLALVAYWSPLVAIGLAVFILADLCPINALQSILQNKRVYVLSVCLVIPYYLYLSRDLSSVNHGWAIGEWSWFIRYYLQFIIFSFGVIITIVLLLSGLQLDRRYMLVSSAIVLVAPLYHFGTYNDFTMRGPMVGYYFLLASAGNGALNLLRRFRNSGRYKTRLIAASMALMISSVAPLYDTIPVVKSIMVRNVMPPYDTGVMDLLEKDDLRFERLVPITHTKKTLLRPIEVCQ